MFDLKIEQLRLNIQNAAGHEHRLEPIARRAVALLAEQLDGPRGMGVSALSQKQYETLDAGPLDLNLHVMTDDQAAASIATAWAKAFTARPHETD